MNKIQKPVRPGGLILSESDGVQLVRDAARQVKERLHGQGQHEEGFHVS